MPATIACGIPHESRGHAGKAALQGIAREHHQLHDHGRGERHQRDQHDRVANFDSTVSASDNGSDFQNSTERSRRSAYSESSA